MPRKFLIPLLTAGFLATPAFAPATMTSLSGSALAQKTTTDAVNPNSSRSKRTKNSGNKFRATWIREGGKPIKRKKLRRIETR